MNSYSIYKDDRESKLIEKDDFLQFKKHYSYNDPAIQNDFGEVLDLESQKNVNNSSQNNDHNLRKTASINTNKTTILSRISNLFDKNQISNLRNSHNPGDKKNLTLNNSDSLNNNGKSIILKKQKTQLNFLQSELMGMGFELGLVNNVLKYYEVNTIELAIEYLTKTNNKWNHPFLSFELVDDINDNNISIFNQPSKIQIEKSKEEISIKCLICGELADLHLGYTKFKSSHENKELIGNKSNNRENINFDLRSNDSKIEIQRQKSRDSSSIDIKKINLIEDLSLKRIDSVTHSEMNQDKQDNKSSLRKSVSNIFQDDNKDTQKSGSFASSKENQEEKFCDICLSFSSDNHTLSCQHTFCKECLTLFLTNKFNNSEVDEITCPSNNCKTEIDQETIKKLVSTEDFQRYEKFLLRNKIVKNPKCTFCPIVDCESYAEYPDEIYEKCRKEAVIELDKNLVNSVQAENVDNSNDALNFNKESHSHLEKPKENSDIILITDTRENALNENEKLLNENTIIKESNELGNQKYDKFKLTSLLKSQKIILVCKEHQHAFCNLCRKYAHGDSDCGKKLQEEYQIIAENSKHIRKCPRCDFYIEKNQGCNHMTCYNRECMFQFCWICMREYNGEHYNSPLSPCFGLQYLNQDNLMIRCPFLLYIKSLLFFILFLIGFPIVIALAPIAPPIILWIGAFVEDYLNFNSGCNRNLYVFIGFCTYFLLGVALLPIGFLLLGLGVGIGTLVGIAAFFYQFYIKCCCGRN